MSEVLAVIRNPGIGMRDLDEPGLWFDTYTDESRAALQVLDWVRAKEVMRFVNRNVSELEGKVCWVHTDGTVMKYLRMFGEGTDAGTHS